MEVTITTTGRQRVYLVELTDGVMTWWVSSANFAYFGISPDLAAERDKQLTRYEKMIRATVAPRRPGPQYGRVPTKLTLARKALRTERL